MKELKAGLTVSADEESFEKKMSTSAIPPQWRIKPYLSGMWSRSISDTMKKS